LEAVLQVLLLLAALACQSGDRAVDLSGKVPGNLQFIDFVISVEPFYARVYVYEPTLPNDFQQCCSNKPTSVLRLPSGTGHFCVRQSQPRMKWTIRALFRPDIEL
jgi:hypothetical protein